MKKRFPGLAVSLLLAAVLLAGCAPNLYSGTSSSSNNTSPDAAPGTVSLLVWGAQDEQSLLKELGASFSGSFGSQYAVSSTIMGPAGAPDEILRNSAAADIIPFSADQLSALVSQGALLPVAHPEEVISANTEASVTAASVDGTLYAYPAAATTFFLYYDKSRFSPEEVNSIETILSKEIDGVETNLAIDLTEGYYTSSFFLANGCVLSGEADGPKVDSAAGLEAAEALLHLAEHPNIASLKDDEIVEGFRRGTLGAAVSGIWNYDSISRVLGENLGCVKLPVVNIGGTDRQLYSLGGFRLYGVSSGAEDPEAAHKLAGYLTDQEAQRRFLEEKGYAPTNRVLIEDASLMNPVPPAEKESSNDKAKRLLRRMESAVAAQGVFQISQGTLAQTDQIREPLNRFGQGILDGSVTRENLEVSLGQLAAELAKNPS